jgi:3-oxoacyl-[acyl-carrier protein] reductase
MLAVNVRGVFLAIQAAVARMRDGGRVITIGSNTAVRTGSQGSSVYAMTKAAVAAMVKGWRSIWRRARSPSTTSSPARPRRI